MVNKYERAYTEVLEILKYLPKEEYGKLPKEKIDFYRKNRDKDYLYNINPQLELSKQDISEEANAILVSLFRDYMATEKQKRILKNLLKQNQEKLEETKKAIYDKNNMFKKS